MRPSAPTKSRSSVRHHGYLRAVFRAALGVSLGIVLGACQQTVDPPSRTDPNADSPTPELGPPDVPPISFACAGFDAAVAADAPSDRLLSTTAKHAVELGGPRVELATRRWALLPPQGLLEEIDRYEQTGADPSQCAGLRAHLERLAILASSH
jgi:hypothetical protein